MLFAIKFDIDTEKLKGEIDEYVDYIHDTFRDEMVGHLRQSGPVESGEMRRSWVYRRESKHRSVIANPTKQARFLQGTGLWGPRGTVITPVRARYLVFRWKYLNYKLIRTPYVRGINPRQVHGAPGEIYDFIEVMNTAIRQGWDKTLSKVKER